MKKVRILTFLASVAAGAIITTAVFAQWHPQKSNTDASLWGLSIVNGNVVWLSGTGGTFVRTTPLPRSSSLKRAHGPQSSNGQGCASLAIGSRSRATRCSTATKKIHG